MTHVEQQLRLMVNAPALLDALEILLPLARREAEALSAAAVYAIGYSTTQEAADKWVEAVMVGERALAAIAPEGQPSLSNETALADHETFFSHARPAGLAK
jgi:hypothetical protein